MQTEFEYFDSLDIGKWHFEEGDPVKISGRPGTFRFIQATRNPETGNTWVDVAGPFPHHEQMNSFRPNRVVKPPRRISRASVQMHADLLLLSLKSQMPRKG
jgi:hypothetical protein